MFVCVFLHSFLHFLFLFLSFYMSIYCIILDYLWVIATLLSIDVYLYLPTYLPTYLSIYLSICFAICLSIWLSIHLSIRICAINILTLMMVELVQDHFTHTKKATHHSCGLSHPKAPRNGHTGDLWDSVPIVLPVFAATRKHRRPAKIERLKDFHHRDHPMSCHG